jgi:riboflavin biosynthesis pyrimidine reductase
MSAGAPRLDTGLDLDTAADIEAALGRIYGAGVAEATGVVHVAAVWQAGPEHHVTIAIGDGAPASERDLFVLQAARARADAIVTTGRTMRAEPALQFDLESAPQRRWAPALAAWRRAHLGKAEPPLLLVLTSGSDLPLAHPALHGASTPLIFTSHQGARDLPETPLHVMSVHEPDIRAAIAHLRIACGCQTILIEAGPSTTAALYQPPVAVDELLLSVFQGAALPVHARARDFVAPAHIRACLPRVSPGYAAEEASGLWQFWRFTR